MGASQSRKDQAKDAYALSVQAFLLPTGLYPTCAWDNKVIRRLVLTKKVAPLYGGKEEYSLNPETDGDFEECPICFLYYPGGLNRTSCCKKGICTECYFQIRKPNLPASCPYCNKPDFAVAFTGPLSSEEKEKEALEQQRVLDLKIKIRNEEIQQDIQRENERKSRLSMPLTSSQNGENSSLMLSTSLPLDFSRNTRNVVASESSSEVSEENSNILPIPSPSSSRQNPPISDSDNDLDDMMLNEAIRLSLKTPSTPNSPGRRDLVAEINAEGSPRRDISNSIGNLRNQVRNNVESESETRRTSPPISNSNRQSTISSSDEETTDDEDLALALALSMSKS